MYSNPLKELKIMNSPFDNIWPSSQPKKMDTFGKELILIRELCHNYKK